MAQAFVIDQVSWHTGTPGNTESRDQILRRFSIIANFLQDNGLSSRVLSRTESDIDDSFNISSDDLTEEGLAVMKAAYDKWLQKVDNGMPPEDVSLLTRALHRVRSA
jgi:hypothetical protein